MRILADKAVACLIMSAAVLASSCERQKSQQKDEPTGEIVTQVAPQSTCPAERVYGDPDAANQLVLENAYGRRIFGFDGVAGIIDLRGKGDPAVLVEFPEVGYDLGGEDPDTFSFGVHITGFQPQKAKMQAGYYPATSRLQIDCMVFHLGDHRFKGDFERSHFVMPVDTAGELEGEFRFTGEGDTTISGRVATDALVARQFHAPTNDDVLFPIEGQPTKLHVEYDRAAKELFVQMLGDSGNRREGFRVPNFEGKAGVYYGDEPFRDSEPRDIFIVEKFSEKGARVSHRKAPAAQLSKEPPTIAEALELGELQARVESGLVVIAPTVEPVDLATATTKDRLAGPEDDFATCPARKVYGPESAPARVHLTTKFGERIYRLPRIRVSGSKREIEVVLPPFGYDLSKADLKEGSSERTANDVMLWADLPKAGSSEVAARVRASMRELPPDDCFAFPRHFDIDEQRLAVEEHRLPGEKPGEFEAKVEVALHDYLQSKFVLAFDTDAYLRGGVRTPISDDTTVRDRYADGGYAHFDKGSFLYDPDDDTLMVGLTQQSGYRSFHLHVPEKPGIYVKKPKFRGDIPVIVVESFEDSHVRVLEYSLEGTHYTGKLPGHPDDILPAEGLSQAFLDEKGQLEKRVESHHLVRLPSIAPVDFAKP